MALKAQFYKHTLNFTFDAGTSRGVLKKKDSYFIKLYDDSSPQIFGIGESGPLEGLSQDYGTIAESKLKEIVNSINDGLIPDINDEAYDMFPSVRFALETAIKDLKYGGIRKIYNNDFFNKGDNININGLVWMGNKAFMKEQIVEKINAGFDTIKLKIGAINFDDEIELIAFIRTEFSESDISIRVDANGAFDFDVALEKMNILSEYRLHSIEQPIKAGQIEKMAELCEKSQLSIALDEELIANYSRKETLLEHINPHYIILKPSLMGGFSGTRAWIESAEKLKIKWWITSALESNVGLNAICQFASEFDNNLPQGLGTGKLYENNFDSPLSIERDKIFYDSDKYWNLSFFK